MGTAQTQWRGWSEAPDGLWDRALFFAEAAWEGVRGDAVAFALATLSAAFLGLTVTLLRGDVVLLPLAVAVVAAIGTAVAGVACDVALLRRALTRWDGRRERAEEAVAGVGERFVAVVAWTLLQPAALVLCVLVVGLTGLTALAAAAWMFLMAFVLPVVALDEGGPQGLAGPARSIEVARLRVDETLFGLVTSGVLIAIAAVPGAALVRAGDRAEGAGGLAMTALGVALLVAGIGAARAYGKLLALAVARHELRGTGTFGFEPSRTEAADGASGGPGGR